MSQEELMTKEVGAILEGYRLDGIAGILTPDEYAAVWITMRAEEFRMEVQNG